MGSKKPRQRRSFTPEFKAEIVELCQRADRSVGQVAGDFDLTETARVHAQLVRRGHRHGRKRVARIMRASGLRGRAAKRWKKTTIADPAARCDHGRWCHTGRQGSHELRSVS
jgi:transposase InsO family protein